MSGPMMFRGIAVGVAVVIAFGGVTWRAWVVGALLLVALHITDWVAEDDATEKVRRLARALRPGGRTFVGPREQQ